MSVTLTKEHQGGLLDFIETRDGQLVHDDDYVSLFHADGRAALLGLPDRSVDLVITDPPYDERTHTMARSNNGNVPAGGRALSGSQGQFGSWTLADQYDVFEQLGRITKGWVIASVPFSVAAAFDLQPPEGLRCLRVGAWIKTQPMPMPSGDRPAMGWETFVCLHRADTKPSWNNGGRAINYVGATSQNTGHPTSKPLPMVTSWVEAFSQPGDLILDPFCGAGTTLRAAKNTGRFAVGFETEAHFCAITTGRLGGMPTHDHDTLFGDQA